MTPTLTHVIELGDHPYLSPSCMWSAEPLRHDEISDFLYAQLIVESQWLDEFPTLVFPFNEKVLKYKRLFEDVAIVYPESWDAIEENDRFLLNKKMFELCRGDGDGEGDDMVCFKMKDSNDLSLMFEMDNFVVATVGVPTR